MGALSVNSPSQKRYDGDMTFLGRVLAHLPVSLHLGKMIVLGHVFGVLDDCLIIGTVLISLFCPSVLILERHCCIHTNDTVANTRSYEHNHFGAHYIYCL